MSEIRIGKVSAVDEGDRLVRVRFPDINMTSGWLKVLDTTPSTRYGDAPQLSPRTDREDLHYHNINFISWFPDVGDLVLCLYNSGFNEDGYVLGALK